MAFCSSLVKLSFVAHFLCILAKEYEPVIPCGELQPPEIHGATVLDISAEETVTDGAEVCNVNIYITHGDAGDRVRIQTYLPLKGYTGRFQGLGGGGMVAGRFDDHLSKPASQGFAAGSTDAGRPNATASDDTWAGDEQLLRNFAYLSVHEMTVVGKSLAAQFYGQPVEFSYWNGCSTGGRQGYEEVQSYPNDYNGVLAIAPAISMDRFSVADLYPYLVQVWAEEFTPVCIWETITAAAIAACDELDGGKDMVINDPFGCRFNAESVVGEKACDTTITEVHARMWNDITRGPLGPDGQLLWGGLVPGTQFVSLAGSEPFSITRAWVAAFVEGDRNFSIASIKPDEFWVEFQKSQDMFNTIIGGDKPDISAFRDAGGKLLSWHGLVDRLIPAYGTIDYRLRVEEALGGNEAVNEFYRLFLAPGVDHCSLGIGAEPSEPLQLLMDWVEKGEAPEVMPASGRVGERNLCLYPKKLVYAGEGDLADASSWTCKGDMRPLHTPTEARIEL
ncbi:hypothetical protein ACJ41O_012147 [Fusarium nematophilum]